MLCSWELCGSIIVSDHVLEFSLVILCANRHFASLSLCVSLSIL